MQFVGPNLQEAQSTTKSVERAVAAEISPVSKLSFSEHACRKNELQNKIADLILRNDRLLIERTELQRNRQNIETNVSNLVEDIYRDNVVIRMSKEVLLGLNTDISRSKSKIAGVKVNMQMNRKIITDMQNMLDESNSEYARLLLLVEDTLCQLSCIRPKLAQKEDELEKLRKVNDTVELAIRTETNSLALVKSQISAAKRKENCMRLSSVCIPNTNCSQIDMETKLLHERTIQNNCKVRKRPARNVLVSKESYIKYRILGALV